MSHHSDSDGSAGVPDDRLFVRPYATPSGRAPRATTPAWPHTGPVPVSFRAPEPRRGEVPGRAPGAEPPGAGTGRERGSRVPLVAMALFALAAAGGTAFLLSGPDPEPRRAVKPPELSVPVLPARSPGAGADPSPKGSARSSAPPSAASASASGPGPAGASAGRTPKPAAPEAPSGPPSPGASGTLRMGDRGPEVRALQERLYGQGFTYVSVTGEYDSQTKRGVAQLQRDRDIKGDQPGVYGPATRAALGG
ncbi:peptidoglycan-binding protein [Streptomyces sp. NPDC051109]|uniref:peptidoglycan-binding domain-containing protein n=1 Tax=Streptomyces sp. NPDC051109 TaxID=3365642 RepID=UPI0037984956